MTDQSNLATLEETHRTLETKIEEEEKRPHPDDLVLHDLKREKLRVKDAIFKLRE